MIWHLLEVWAALLVTFLFGCILGALLYDLVARSRLAPEQGAIADSVGDVVDRIKDRLGMGPAWRSAYRRIAGAADAEAAGVDDDLHGEVVGDDRIADWRAPPPLRETADIDDDLDWPEAIDPIAVREVAPEPLPRSPRLPRLSHLEAPTASAAKTGEPDTRPAAGEDGIVPMRPASLAEPRNGVPDNLQRIRGIGERNEVRLNQLGIFHFGQIAAWTPAETRWVAQQLAFPERIERDDWVGQAIVLASGGDTGFTKSAERRRARRRGESMDEPHGNGDPGEPR